MKIFTLVDKLGGPQETIHKETIQILQTARECLSVLVIQQIKDQMKVKLIFLIKSSNKITFIQHQLEIKLE